MKYAPITLLITGLSLPVSVLAEDEGPTFDIGGRIMWDMDFFDGVYSFDDNYKTSSESEFRRAWLELEGSHGPWGAEVIISVDDDASSVWVDTADFTYNFGDQATIHAGRLKLPASLEVMTSSKWITTIERSVIQDILRTNTNEDQYQIGVAGKINKFGYNLQLFDSGYENENGLDSWGLGARLFYAPIAEDNQALHFGLSAAGINAQGEEVKVRSRLGVHTIGRPLAASIYGGQDRQFGLEAAYMTGPFSIQGEYGMREIDGEDDDSGTNLKANGGYIQAAYTLTGASRKYKASSGKFDKLPAGSWEVVAKAEQMSIEETSKPDAKGNVYTLGLNWYPMKNVKLMLNYLHADTDNAGHDGPDEESGGNAITGRIQYVF